MRLQPRCRAEYVAELRVLRRRQRLQHAPLLEQLALDLLHAREDLEAGREIVALDVYDGRGELVDHQLHPQLGGLVLNDEQHLVVMRRARLLRGEQALEAEVAAVGGVGGKVGDEAGVFLGHGVNINLPIIQPPCSPGRSTCGSSSTLTAVLDPFLAVPIFLSVTASRSARVAHRLAASVTITVFVVLAGAALLRRGPPHAARREPARVPGRRRTGAAADGARHAERAGRRHAPVAGRGGGAGDRRATAASCRLRCRCSPAPARSAPRSSPPQAGGVAHVSALLGCIALVSALALGGAAPRPTPSASGMGTTGLNIATRLLGLLLAAIAIETMADGLKVLFPGP